MSLLTRLQRLESTAAPQGGGIAVIWTFAVHREGEALVSSLCAADVLAGPLGPGERFLRTDSESEEAFTQRVTEAAKRIHGRDDPALGDGSMAIRALPGRSSLSMSRPVGQMLANQPEADEDRPEVLRVGAGAPVAADHGQPHQENIEHDR